MPKPEIHVLRHALLRTQNELARLAARDGEETPQYQAELGKLRQLWALLHMTRSPHDFLPSSL